MLGRTPPSDTTPVDEPWDLGGVFVIRSAELLAQPRLLGEGSHEEPRRPERPGDESERGIAGHSVPKEANDRAQILRIP